MDESKGENENNRKEEGSVKVDRPYVVFELAGIDPSKAFLEKNELFDSKISK